MDLTAQFEHWLQEYLLESRQNPAAVQVLQQSQEYSLSSGGKRFRPVLAGMIYSLFSDDFHKIRSLSLFADS